MSDAEQARRIEGMPKEVGVLLVMVGLAGLVLPGPFGTPFILMGGVALWPRAFRGVDGAFERRFPKAHDQAARVVIRFLDDLERRYPQERQT
jgi:hypothetical protein